jgi:D-3-phosphoglycerate dehydrogenase
MLFFFYEDKPGVIGAVGTTLGDHRINIATMDVGRPIRGGTALMGLVLDSPVPPEVLAEIENVSGAEGIRFIQLPE